MKKARRAQPAGRGVYGCRGTISRVMSWVIICLDLPLPAGSSNQPVTGRAALRHVSVLLRMGFTCARPVTVPAVVSYTALPPLPTPSLAARRFRRYSHSASLHARTWLRHILSETLFTILMQASARDRASDTAGLGVGGIFLLHCPGSRLRRPLAGILPCEARTFLTCSFREVQTANGLPQRFAAAITCPSAGAIITEKNILSNAPTFPHQGSYL